MIRVFVEGANHEFASILCHQIAEYQVAARIVPSAVEIAARMDRESDVGVVFAADELAAVSKVRAVRNFPSRGLLIAVSPPSPISNGMRRAVALKAGADDALTVPIRPAEFFERLKALVRRDRTAASDHIDIGEFRWHVGPGFLKHRPSGFRVPMQPAPARLFAILADARGAPVSVQSLSDQLAAGTGRDPCVERIKVHISYLRSALRKFDAAAGALIETRYGAGYRLAVPE